MKTCLLVLGWMLSALWAQAQDWGWAKSLPLTNTAVAGSPAGRCYISGSFSGSVRIGGSSFSAAGATDSFIGCFTADGALLWGRTLGGPGPVLGGGASHVTPADISADASGNCYVTGSFDGTIANVPGAPITATWGWNSLFTAKYSAAGTVQWVRAGGSTEYYSKAGAVAVDAGGNSYVTGVSSYHLVFDGITRSTGLKYQIFVACYSPAGTIQWLTTTSSSSVNNLAQDIAVDGSGGVYVTGLYSYTLTIGSIVLPANSVGTPPDVVWYPNLVLARFRASTGQVMWARWAGGSGSYAAGEGLATDDAGNSYVTGRYNGAATFGALSLSAGSIGSFAARYASDGTPQWVVPFGATSNSGRCRTATSRDGSRVYVLTDRAALTPPPVAVRRLRPSDGATLWRLDMRGQAYPFGLGLTSANELFATGFFVNTALFGPFSLTAASPSSDFLTRITEPAARAAATDSPAATAVGEAYPNPAHGYTTVPLTEAATASIRDAIGREVLRIRLLPQSGPATLDVRALPAGIYLLELQGVRQATRQQRLVVER